MTLNRIVFINCLSKKGQKDQLEIRRESILTKMNKFVSNMDLIWEGIKKQVIHPLGAFQSRGLVCVFCVWVNLYLNNK